MVSFLHKLFGDASARATQKLLPTIEEINRLEPTFEGFSSEELRELSARFRERLKKGETLDDMLAEAFAAIREAAKRTLQQRHFDVQLMGGIVLHRGGIAEMRTGEGKTLTSTLAAYLNALAGQGVHMVTVNDYLARRDAVWMGQVYRVLGLSVACINHDASYVYDEGHRSSGTQASLDTVRDQMGAFKVMHEFLRPVPRKEAYEADITYGTNTEFGFDYLRDNLAQDPSQLAQRAHAYAIVDEVDSILIDEARTPLIISAPSEESAQLYEQFARVAPHLSRDTDYVLDEKRRAVTLTDAGIEKAEKLIGVTGLYDAGNVRLLHHLEQALKAEFLFKRDKDYVVKDGEVIIVDEFTGRLLPGRRYSEGLHQAIEAKEKAKIQKESRTVASITFQNYFRMYDKLAGMTGTALTNAEEFFKVYQLEVSVIPTNRPMVRRDLADVVYKTQQAKWYGVIEEIRRRHEAGQPVLIGTTSIEKNEYLAALLAKEGVAHKVLNAKNHEEEGAIIAQAGRFGAVTLATNIAGRGVDIILGGNPRDEAEYEKVRERGGLHVIGTERHEARRIDNQLRGRSGRQGDPGSSQFFVSLEDDVMRVFGGEGVKRIMDSLGIPEEIPIENKMVSRAIERAQERIEGYNFDARKHVLEYDDVVNKQRAAVYRRRRDALMGEADIKAEVKSHLEEYLTGLVEANTTEQDPAKWERELLAKQLSAILPQDVSVSTEKFRTQDREELSRYVREVFNKEFEKREEEFKEEAWGRILRSTYLQALDSLWMGQLEELGYLRETVSLRAWGQRDPLVEYKKEAKALYRRFWDGMSTLLAVSVFRVAQVIQPQQSERYQEGRDGGFAAGSSRQVAISGQTVKKVGRNDMCPCGSGKKYKKCHGA